jgi:hypothetical protein
MSLPTCSSCQFFQLPHGESKGFCYGLPPAVYPSGAQQVNPPMVKLNRPMCSLYQGLPDGQPPNAKVKTSPETPGDAAKLAHAQKAADEVEMPSWVPPLRDAGKVPRKK